MPLKDERHVGLGRGYFILGMRETLFFQPRDYIFRDEQPVLFYWSVAWCGIFMVITLVFASFFALWIVLKVFVPGAVT